MFNKSKTPMPRTAGDTQKTTTSKTSGGTQTTTPSSKIVGSPAPKPTGGVQTIPSPTSMTGAPAPKPAGGAGWVSPYKGYPYRYKGQIHCHSCSPITNKDNLITYPLFVVAGLPGLIAGEILGESIAVGLDAATERFRFSIEPEVVSKCYKKKGYKFLCLTDHHIIRQAPNDKGILHIYSVEDGMSYDHHIEVLGINFNAARSREAAYFDKNHDGVCDWLSSQCDNLPGRIYYYSRIQNAITVLGHPKQSHGRGLPGTPQGYSLDDLRKNAQAQYRGRDYTYTGIEIYNAGFNQLADDWWDQLLEEGKRLWGFGSDDCHRYYLEGQGSDKLKDPQSIKLSTANKRTFNRSWIVVFSNKVMETAKQTDSQADILQNIRDGNFYTVVRSPDVSGDTPGEGSDYSGPWFDINVSGNKITVTTDPDCTHIRAISGPGRVDKHKLLPTPNGKKAVTFEPSPKSKYVRVVWETSFKGEWYRIFSQPLFNMSVVKTR